MTTLRSLTALPLLLILAARPDPAQTQSVQDLDPGVASLLFAVQRFAVQFGLLNLRTFTDLTYDSISFDPRTGDTSVNGLRVSPRLPWDPSRACTIEIERLVGYAAQPDVDTLRSDIEIEGVGVPAACFEPAVALTVQGLGYERIEVSAAALSMAYTLSSSAAELRLSADLDDAAALDVATHFDYVWVAGLGRDDPDDFEPLAHLESAEIQFVDAGLWERIKPMVSAQVGDLNAAPALVRVLLGQVLAGPGGTTTPEKTAFVDNVATELERFIRDGDRLVLKMAPTGGAWLDDDLFQTPQRMIETLEPELSVAPLAAERVIAPALVTAALTGEADLAPEVRLEVGEALLSGIGAPKAVGAGLDLLAPLAEAWNGEAAALMSKALLDEGDIIEGYALALRAMAASTPGAQALASRAEAELGVGEMLDIQATALAEWPEAGALENTQAEAIEAGDVNALRRLAAAAEAGRAQPRDHAGAYRLAALAAAGGNAGAAQLRDRLDARFTDGDGTDPDWAGLRDEVAAEALEVWTEGGLGARVLERYGR
ncbi:MAG: hypothetical protein AAGI34_17965 [Pseudomonadota bacterium]